MATERFQKPLQADIRHLLEIRRLIEKAPDTGLTLETLLIAHRLFAEKVRARTNRELRKETDRNAKTNVHPTRTARS